MLYKLSLQAETDLEDIYRYTLETWGIQQFDKYRNDINKTLIKIAEDPYLVNSKSREDLYPECRLYKIHKHYIAYIPDKNGIMVGRVLHEQMDFPNQILEGYFKHDAK